MIDKDTVERQLYGHVDVAKRDLPDGFSVGPLDAVGGSDGALLGPDNNERVVEKSHEPSRNESLSNAAETGPHSPFVQ